MAELGRQQGRGFNRQSALHTGEADALNEGALGEEDNDHRQREHGGGRHQQGPFRAVMGEEEPQAHRQRELVRVPQEDEDQRVDVVVPPPHEVEDGAGGGRLTSGGCTSWPTMQAARLGEYLSLNLATCHLAAAK